MRGKKGGVPIVIVLLVILTIVLVTATLSAIKFKKVQVNDEISSATSLGKLSARESIISFHLQEMLEESVKGASSEQEFMDTFRAKVFARKNGDLGQILVQVNEGQMSFDGQKVEAVFEIRLPYAGRDGEMFSAVYTFQKEFKVEV